MALLAQRDFLCQDSFSDCVGCDFVTALCAGGHGEGAVALDDPFYARAAFQCVDVLRVVAEEFAVLFEQFYKPAGRGNWFHGLRIVIMIAGSNLNNKNII